MYICIIYMLSLSMLAVRAGAARVYACEMNATMVTLSRDVISANEMADKIKVIHKMSTDCDVPDDIPERYVELYDVILLF